MSQTTTNMYKLGVSLSNPMSKLHYIVTLDFRTNCSVEIAVFIP
jgi:hypothetical protein